MTLMIIGQQTLPLDEQGRTSVPEAYRQACGPRAYLTRGFDRNLLLLPSPAFEKLAGCVASASLTDPLLRHLSRLLLGGAAEVELQADGGMQIPQPLRDYAGLQGEVRVVGQGGYAEIWDPAHWEAQSREILDHQANAERFARIPLSLS